MTAPVPCLPSYALPAWRTDFPSVAKVDPVGRDAQEPVKQPKKGSRRG